MKLVADTNIFLAVVLDEPAKAEIIRLTSGVEIVAPEVLPFELGNALSALLKRSRLTPEAVLKAWDMIQLIPVELRNIDIRQALEIASQYQIYAYDAYFLQCALTLRTPLLTLDRRMMQVAQQLGVKTIEVAK